MEKRYIVLIFSVFITLSFSSCKRNKIHKKEIVAVDSVSVANTDTVVKQEILTVVVEEKKENPTFTPATVDFKYMKIRSKADFSLSGEQQSVNLTANIRKDSLIWLSLGLMGVEGGRGIITRDSIIFLDRLHRNYYKLDFASLSQQFNFNLNFDIIQSLLIGNMPINNQPKYEYTEQGDSWIVNQDEKIVSIENYFNKTNQKLEKVFAADSAGKSKLQISYANFLTVSNLLVPHEVKAQIDAQTKEKVIQSIVNLQYSKVELSEQNPGFNFSIPKSYSPVNLKKQ